MDWKYIRQKLNLGTNLGVSIVALSLLIPIGTMQFLNRMVEAEADSSPTVQAADPLLSSQVHTSLNGDLREGQPIYLFLNLSSISAEQTRQGVSLVVSYQEAGYDMKPYQYQQPLNWQGHHIKHPLIFQSSGDKKVILKTPEGHILKELSTHIAPFKASIFPQKWESNRNHPPDPSRWQIRVNLYSEPLNPKGQRQYLQITFDDQVLDRFLISSGAPGYDTPLGSFKLGFKDYYPRSRRYNNTPMPFWSAINMNGNEGEYGFHSLEDGGYLYLLGRPASHGCVRLSRLPSVETDPQTGEKRWGDRGGARWIYDRVPPETKVTLFKAKLPAFEFEDYAMYLARSQ